MKNLKKALALTIASVSVFGTIASADFLNPMDSSPNMQQMAATAASGATFYDSYKTFGDKSEITYDETTQTMKWDHKASGYTYIYMNGNESGRAADERHSSFGKIKMVATFSFDNYATDENGVYIGKGQGQLFNAGYLTAAMAYKKQGETKVTYGDVATLNFSTKYENNPITWGTSILSLLGKTVNHNMVGYSYGDKVTLTLEADCIADTATFTLYNDTKGKEIAKLEVTEDDGIDIICVKDGFYGREYNAWDMTWYKFSSVREQFVAKDAKVEKSGNAVTGKISVANNAESNVTAIKNPSATVIMALYDANGKMIDCGMSAATALPIRKGNDKTNGDADTVRVQNAPTFVEIEATAEASDYAYAKFFVWDGTDTMNPFTEAVKVNAN